MIKSLQYFISSCLFVLLLDLATDFKWGYFFEIFVNRCSTLTVSCCVHAGWQEHLYLRHVDFPSCSPSDSRFSGAAAVRLWMEKERRMLLVNSCKRSKVQLKKSTRGVRRAADLSSCLLMDWWWDALGLLPCCPVSLWPWIKAQTLSIPIDLLCPSFTVYSIFEACPKHVLFLLGLTVSSECLCTVLATVVHLCGPPWACWGCQDADLSSTWFDDLNETPLENITRKKDAFTLTPAVLTPSCIASVKQRRCTWKQRRFVRTPDSLLYVTAVEVGVVLLFKIASIYLHDTLNRSVYIWIFYIPHSVPQCCGGGC